MATHVDNQSAVPMESAKTTTANNEIDDKSLNLNTPNNNTAVITINVKNPETQNEVPNFMPAVPSPTPAERLYHEAAATHGGDETSAFLVQELNTTLQEMQLHQQQQQQQNKDATISRNPSTIGKYEKKIGHRRIDDLGDVTYKRIKSKQIMGSIQLGIQQTVGSLASKPKRDLLMNDFWEMETLSFPPEGSATTPAHHYSDFKFKVYAPIAFRYFRDLFGIAPDDFLMSMCAAPLLELSNPGASGSLFYVTNDDEFIIKTVQKKECEFLQKLLPGYYMNLSQNPRTLLPKFFGLYCFNYNTKNVRLVAMNNLLPSDMKMHAKYDLKGSTHGRKASKQERQKASPTFKDLDFMEHFPSGIFLETDKYNALKKTIERDCMVLESFQIMDYSLLVGVHNVDLAAKEKREERIRNARAKRQKNDDGNEAAVEQMQDKLNTQISNYNPAAAVAAAAASISSIGLAAGGASAAGVSGSGTNLNRSRSMNRQRVVAHSTPMESITADMEELEDVPAGGIPARSENDERLILYIGIIDILQSYRLEKKLEHTFKSIIYNGDTVSVCRPSFYSKRFQNFITKTVFRKTPTFPLKHSPSKRKSSTVSSLGNARFTPSRANNQSISHMTLPTRMQLSMGASTPPPAFDDISEEELTATSSSAFNKSNRHTAQRSHMSSVIDSDSDDDSVLATRMSPRSSLPLRQSLHLSKTSVQVTTIGCVEDTKMPPQANKQIIVINNNNDREHEQFTDYTDNQQAVETAGDGGIINEQLVSTTKTTTVKAMKQATYTSTLVVNDVIS